MKIHFNCLTRSISFDSDDRTFAPTVHTITANVIKGINGSLRQQINCSVGDGPKLGCVKKGENTIILATGGFRFTGELSEDENLLTIIIPL